MGRLKSKQTAKTGSSGRQHKRKSPLTTNNTSAVRNNDDDDDVMYSKADKFHSSRDVENEIKLNDLYGGSSKGRGDNDDEFMKVDHVLDLGLADDDDDDDDEDDDDASSSSSSSAASSSSSDDDEMDNKSLSSSSSSSSEDDDKKSNILNWGKNKKSYYHGDTADLEIGQEEDDAVIEEEAGKDILKHRYEGMTTDDFMLFDDDDNAAAAAKDTKKKKGDGETTRTEVIKTRKKRKEGATAKAATAVDYGDEFLPICEYFTDHAVTPLKDVVSVVMSQLNDNPEEMEAIGLTPGGKSYLETKQLLLLTIVLNFTNYLHLKATSIAERTDSSYREESPENDLKSHAIVDRLNELNDLMTVMKKRIEVPCGLVGQLEKITKAVELVNSGGVDDDDEEEEEGGGMVVEENDNDDSEDEESIENDKDASPTPQRPPSPSSSSTSSDDDDETDLRNEALFSTRPDDLSTTTTSNPHRRRRRAAPPLDMDYGDIDDDLSNKNAGRELSQTMNRLQQKKSTLQKKKKDGGGAEDYDPDDNERLKKGFEMMDAELGPPSDDDDDDDDNDDDQPSKSSDDPFYTAMKSHQSSKKAKKSSTYSATPRYNTLDTTIDGERAISRKMLKNRGLVAHKSKLSRNPRVKKREQYRKALIRRKGAVREVRVGEVEGYGGEMTGIKGGLSRSRKLGVGKR